MQVGEIFFRAARAVERFHVGLELDQIAADETRGEAASGAAIGTSSHAESRQEPLIFASVSSGVCTPGSMRMVYLMSFHNRWLMATMKSFVARLFAVRHFQPLLFRAPLDFAEQIAAQLRQIFA